MRADLDAAEAVALGRAIGAALRVGLLLRAVDDDHPSGVLELEVADLQGDRLGDPQPGMDQHLRERPVRIEAGIEVEGDLLQT